MIAHAEVEEVVKAGLGEFAAMEIEDNSEAQLEEEIAMDSVVVDFDLESLESLAVVMEGGGAASVRSD
jgi:hypothetical protein